MHRRRTFILCGCLTALGLANSSCSDDAVGAGSEIGTDVASDGGADASNDDAVGGDLADAGSDAPATDADVGEDAGDELPTTAPTSIVMVASAGFTSPGDAVASPDGSTFYFTAFTEGEDSVPGIFTVPSAGGAVELIFAGDPLEYPTGLLMSCDGETLFVADMSIGDVLTSVASDIGGIHTLALDSEALTSLDAEGIAVPSGLAMGPDCETLIVTGFNELGQPGVFDVSAEGGAASERLSGAPLVSPTGVYVDEDDVAWVMDHLAVGEDGPGALFSVTPDGDIELVVSDLRMGAPGGVTLAAGGVTAVIAEVDKRGDARLVTINTDSGERSQLNASQMVAPAGIRTASQAGVFVVVDNEGGAIFRAE